MRAIATTSILLLTWVLIGRGPSVRAIEPMALPSFEVTGLDGRTVTSAELATEGRWLALYVQPNCAACSSLLEVARKPEVLSAASRVVIMVGARSLDEVKKMAGEYPELANATWYMDTDKRACTALKLTGSPVIMGVRKSTVQWCFNGILRSSDRLQSLIRDWVGG